MGPDGLGHTAAVDSGSHQYRTTQAFIELVVAGRELAAVLDVAVLASAINCTRRGADPPTLAELLASRQHDTEPTATPTLSALEDSPSRA